MATGELNPVSNGRGRWGASSVFQVRDNALAIDGVCCGDYLVVDYGSMPSDDDGLVVVRDKTERRKKESSPQRSGGKGEDKYKAGGQERLLLRKFQRFGTRMQLQPGSSPRRPLLLPPDAAEIWGTVVAVMRKFDVT